LYLSSLATQSQQMMQQLQPNPTAQSPHVPLQVNTPGMVRPPSGFQLPNNVPNNLHIPPSKQGNLGQPGATANGSPMRPSLQIPGISAANQPHAAVLQRMIQQGISVNPSGIPNGVRSQTGQQISGQDIKPYMLLQQMEQQQPTQGQMEEGRPHPPNQVQKTSDMTVPQLDRSQSLLSRVSWQPSADHDARLKDKISGFQRPLKPSGRATLYQGLGMNRILGEVLLECMPEALRAIAEEAESGVASDAEVGEGGKGKIDSDGIWMPGQKKRKVQELAETVDKALVIDRDVETVSIFCRSKGRVLIEPS